MEIKIRLFRGVIFFIFFGISIVFSGCKVTKAHEDKYPEEKLGWKLGAQAYTFNRFTFTETLDKIASCGLRYVEAYPQQEIGGGITEKMNYQMAESSKIYLKSILKKKGIQLLSYGVINVKDEITWRKVFVFAKSMDIKMITCEPEERFLPLISSLCDEFGIDAAIHNHPKPSYYWDPKIVEEAIAGRSERLGACADIGHWVRSGLDPVESLKKLQGKISHLHFKDLNKKDRKAHDVHWGTGVNNIEEVIGELKRQGFKGMISAEYEHNWENNEPDLKASVINFRNILRASQ